MGLKGHRNWTSLDLIKGSLKEGVLMGLRPTIAAGNQRDLQWIKSNSTSKIFTQLSQVIIWAPIEGWGVTAPCCDLDNEPLLAPLQQSTNLRRWQDDQGWMVKIDFQPIKVIKLGPFTGLG